VLVFASKQRKFLVRAPNRSRHWQALAALAAFDFLILQGQDSARLDVDPKAKMNNPERVFS
jgi:hypothetical protein